jgi:hypothetical protein
VKLQAKTVYIVASFAIGWIVAVVCGLGVLLKYESTPGHIGSVPQSWPGSRIQPTLDRATLVMLVHPHCPCTRASIGELAQIMAHAQGRVTAYVLFLKPENSAMNWERTDLWRSAAAIPGVTALQDLDGDEARRFGAKTSGQTLLFDSFGRLLFSGGITASRGHSGDNAGRRAIVSLLNNTTPDLSQTSVFGCSFQDPEAGT